MKVFVVTRDSDGHDVRIDRVFASEKDAEDYCFQKNFTNFSFMYESENRETNTNGDTKMRVYVVTRAWLNHDDTETIVDTVFATVSSAQTYCARMNEQGNTGYYEYYDSEVEN